MVGGGIATMHYTGMAAFEVQGRDRLGLPLVIASIVLGASSARSRCRPACATVTIKGKTYGALLLTVAICSHHFTAMGAVSIIPDATIEVSKSALPTSWLAVAVALASFAILLLACAALALDIRDRRRAEAETDRMRGLANAAVEGLLVCDGDTIVSANNSFATLAGVPRQGVVGTKLAHYFPDETIRRKMLEAAQRPDRDRACGRQRRRRFRSSSILRPVDFAGRQHHAIAVRDLRARKQAEQHIRFLAHHDALTGLPNRSSFNKKLDDEIEAARAMASNWPCCASISTASRRSTTCSATPPATRCCRSSASPSAGLLDRHPDGGGLAATSSRSSRRPACSGRARRPHRRAHPRCAAHRGRGLHDIRARLEQHRHRHLPERRYRSPGPAQPCRHGALPRQARRARHLPLLRGHDGRRGARPPPPRARPAPRESRDAS